MSTPNFHPKQLMFCASTLAFKLVLFWFVTTTMKIPTPSLALSAAFPSFSTSKSVSKQPNIISLYRLRHGQLFWRKIGNLNTNASGTSTQLFLIGRASTDLDLNSNKRLKGSIHGIFYRTVKTSSSTTTFSTPTLSCSKSSNSISATTRKEEADESSILDSLPRGIPPTFSILHHAAVPSEGFCPTLLENTLPPDIITRLQLTDRNLTLPTALIMITAMQENEDKPGNKFEYTSQSRARKDCRRGVILIHRGPLVTDSEGKESFQDDRITVGRVGDRV